jgi:hypothetical protein
VHIQGQHNSYELPILPVATSLSSLFSKEGLLMKMNLFEWFKRLFKRKKATCIVTSTAQYRYKHFSIKPTTTEEKYVNFPITHPAKYRQFQEASAHK